MPSSVNRIAVLSDYSGRGRRRRGYRGIVTLGRNRRRLGHPWDETTPLDSPDFDSYGRRRRRRFRDIDDRWLDASPMDSPDFGPVGLGRSRRRFRDIDDRWLDASPLDSPDSGPVGLGRHLSPATRRKMANSPGAKKLKACAIKWKKIPEKKRSRLKWSAFLKKCM